MKFRLKINLLASWGDHAVCVLIGLLLMPFVLNTIGDGQYGMWLFICSIAGYSGLMNLGFGETVSRFVAHHHAKGEIDKINGVVNAIGAVYLGMSVLVLLGAGVIAWLAPGLYDWGATSDAELRWVIMVLAANVVVGLLGSVFGGVIVGLQRIDLERTFRSTSGVFRLGITLLMLQREYALVTLAVIFLATTMVENIGYLCVVFRQLPGLKIGWRYFKRQTLKECFGFSVFALLDGFAGKIIDATDTIVIGIAFGTKYIVPYYIAHRLTTFIVEPLHMIGMIAMPRGAQLSALEHDLRLRVLVRKGLGLSFLLVGAFFIGACFFGDHVMQAWVGRHFVESHALLLVLLGAQVIASPIRVLRGVLFGMGHVRYPAIAYMIEAVANLLLTLLLIPHFGLLGVAIGTAIPIVLVESLLLAAVRLEKTRHHTSGIPAANNRSSVDSVDCVMAVLRCRHDVVFDFSVLVTRRSCSWLRRSCPGVELAGNSLLHTTSCYGRRKHVRTVNNRTTTCRCRQSQRYAHVALSSSSRASDGAVERTRASHSASRFSVLVRLDRGVVESIWRSGAL